MHLVIDLHVTIKEQNHTERQKGNGLTTMYVMQLPNDRSDSVQRNSMSIDKSLSEEIVKITLHFSQ